MNVRIDAFMKESVNTSPFPSFEPMNFPFSLFGPWYDCTTLTVLCFNFIHHFILGFEEPHDTILYKHVACLNYFKGKQFNTATSILCFDIL